MCTEGIFGDGKEKGFGVKDQLRSYSGAENTEEDRSARETCCKLVSMWKATEIVVLTKKLAV